MKKSLVLAMAMALGVTASAYAANPFSDVPAGHWAYDSVAKLAAAGVVDGYADGAFDGDKLMTRYEMAQIVAKAMAKGADCDKLAAEFADELDTLGVRVAKLEKGADAVKITGQVRARYVDQSAGDYKHQLRTRLWLNGAINDDWSYTAMFESTEDFDDDVKKEEVKLKRAYLEGKIGGLAVQAGRWNEFPYTGNVLDAFVEGAKVTYGDKVKVWGMVGTVTHGDQVLDLSEKHGDKLYVLSAETKIGAFDTYVGYYKADAANIGDGTYEGKEVYNVGFGVDVAKDLRLGYEYMVGGEEYIGQVSKDGWVARLDYKGAAAEPGTWGIHAQWFDQPVNSFMTPTTDADSFATDGGYEGFNIGMTYTLAKNIMLDLNYYDTEGKISGKDNEMLYADVYFTF
ncbi:MAG: S-layer homology domain-containing protein [Phascolarctobacterium sp.]|nr:S-layer homology domain-containing protein [Phascolarctobacterium sp.]